MADPCPVPPLPSTRAPKGHHSLNTVTIEALDAIELAEILEYFLERVDVLGEHNLSSWLFADCSPYRLGDLRADVTRLIDRLNAAR